MEYTLNDYLKVSWLLLAATTQYVLLRPRLGSKAQMGDSGWYALEYSELGVSTVSGG